MAVRSAVLCVQDVPDGAHVDGVRVDDPGVHRRALRRHLPPTARPGRVDTGTSCQDARRALGGRVRDRRAVLSAHSHLPLPRRPTPL